MTESAGRVFVTGAAGFVGSHVARRFAVSGWEVFGLVHNRVPEPADGVEYVRGDISDSKALAETASGIGADVIVHAAALASDIGPDRLFRKLNFEPVKILAPLAKKKFVFISTADVFGIRDFDGKSTPAAYDDNLRNPYPKYKIMAERWLKGNLSPERFACIRPAAVCGVGDETLEKRAVDFLRHSPFIVHFGKWRGKNRWPLVNVEHVASLAYLAATTTEWDGDGVVAIDPERMTIDGYYRNLAAKHFPGRKFRTLCLPMWIGDAIGRTSTFLSRILRRTRPLFDPTFYSVRTVSSNLDFPSPRVLCLREMENIGNIRDEK